MAVAVRRKRAFDTPVLSGSPGHVLRDAVPFGTAYSAPAPMLVTQALLIPRAARGDVRASRGLQALGAGMVAGHLIERLGRLRLRPSGWDPVETPIVVAGLGLAAAMAVLGPRGANASA